MLDEILDLVMINTDDFGCSTANDTCPNKERTISYAIAVKIPQQPEDYVKEFKECCYTHKVLASSTDDADFKNDYSAFYYQRQANETVSWFLKKVDTDTEYNLNTGLYGSFFYFGYFQSNNRLTGVKINWKSVITSLGVGNYQIVRKIEMFGNEIETYSYTHTLMEYTPDLADKTVRIDVIMNGYLQESNVDFTNTMWEHSLRVPGFFGRRNPTYEEDSLVSREYVDEQISMRQINEYQFQTNLVPSCITNEIFDFILLGNYLFMNDYNANNHSREFVKFGVKLASNSGTVYSANTRKAKLNLVFNKRIVNTIKRNYR